MNLMKTVSLLTAMFLVCVAYGDVDLVKDGKGLADIVVDKDALPSVKFAAEDLQKHIELMSSAKLPIVNAPSENAKNHIYVGAGNYTKKLGVDTDDLKVEGFKIIAKDNCLVLIGRDEERDLFPYSSRRPGDLQKWQEFAGEKYALPEFSQAFTNNLLGFKPMDATATLYAVSEFLEQLGVRWYMPYENGTVIPEKKTISARFQHLKREPRFPYREFCYGMVNDSEGLKWFKRMKYGSSYVYFSNHTTRNILGGPGMKEQHPEYYAMADGRPVGGKRDVPRLCEPGFRNTSVNFLNKVFEAYPPLRYYSLGMPDGLGEIDERDAKIWERQDKDGKFSDYVWDYWLYAAKELKKSHPDRYLACMAYTTYLRPPSNVEKLPDNVSLIMCYWTTWMITSQGKDLKKLRSEWISKLASKKMFIWDAYHFYKDNSPRYPVVFTKLLQEEMKQLSGVCEGKFIEISSTKISEQSWRLSCPGLTHLLHYWQGKLYWDPDMDREKMLNEYYELYFGPAKAEMKEFYEFAEEVWMRPDSRHITIAGGFLKEKDVVRYFEILGRARGKAGRDSVYDKRVARIETEMEPLKKLFPIMPPTGPKICGFRSEFPFTLDGNLGKPFWTANDTWYNFGTLTDGSPLPGEKSAQVSFRMSKDSSALIVGVKCYEPEMDKIKSKTKLKDDINIFLDDVVEIHIETPECSFFKIVVNPEGTIWDECQDSVIVERDTTPLLWDPGTKAAVKKGKDCWTAEIMIPTKDFGSSLPTEKKPWGINVFRNRMAGGKSETSALSSTGTARFLDLSKLCSLWIKE